MERIGIDSEVSVTSKLVAHWHSLGWARKAATVLALSLVSVMGLSSTAGASHSSGLGGKSAKQVWALAVAAANAKGSVHVVLKPFLCCGATNVFGTSGVVVDDSGMSEGKQTLSGGSTYGHATILVFPGTAYVQGDTSWTSMIMSLPSYYAGKWLLMTPSTPNYASTAYGITLGSLLDNLKPIGHLGVKVTTIGGKKVVGISGGIAHSDWPSDVKGSVVFYVSGVAPYLPVEAVYHLTEAGKKITVTGTLSDWGEPISLTPPASSVPFPG